jgi:DNA primase
VNLREGHFRCFACGASGQDVLAFHRKLHGKGFKEAAMELGAWS